MTTFLLAFVTSITVVMQAAFLHDQPLLWTVNYLMDIFFAADMYVQNCMNREMLQSPSQ